MSETEREIEAREECARRGIDPDGICADGGVTAWMVVDQERWRWHRAYVEARELARAALEKDRACPVCGSDCAGANPPMYNCPNARAADKDEGK